MSTKSRLTKLLMVVLVSVNFPHADAAQVVKPIHIASVSVDATTAHIEWTGIKLAKNDAYNVILSDNLGITLSSHTTKSLSLNIKVDPFSKYKIQIRTLHGSKSLWSNTNTFLSKSSAPSNLTVVSSEHTRVSLQWDKVPGATSYLISFTGSGPKIANTNSYTIDSLKPGYSGDVVITPQASGILGIPSEALTVTTLNEAPLNLTSTKATSTGFTLSWSPIAGATSYNIYSKGVLVGNSTASSYAVTGLTPGSTLSYTVRAVFPTGETADSPALDASTIIDTPPAPTATVLNATSVQATWTKNGNVTKYLVSVLDSAGTVLINSASVDPTLTTYTFTGLLAASPYVLGIQYVYGTATSKTSALTSFTTTKPSPTGLVSSSITSTSFILGWDLMPGATSYDVFRDNILLVNTTTNSITLDKLIAGATFKYSVKANYAGLKSSVASDFSTSISVTTLTDPASRPYNSVAPLITLPFANVPIVGATITGSNGLWTTPTGAPLSLIPTFSGQWQRSIDGGANFIDITGATSPTYAVTTTDFGYLLRYKVTATNSNGSAIANSANAGPVASIYNVSPPIIRGNIVVGQVLETTDGVWSSSYQTTYSYQWLRSGSAISGATFPTYTLTNSDLGSSISISITASTTLGNASATGAARGTITPIGNTVAPVITGPIRVGGTLTVTDGTWIGSPDSYSYQWQSSADGTLWDSISGATNSSYTLRVSESAKYIRAQVFGNKTVSGTPYKSTAITLTTSQVPALTLSNTVAPTVSGVIAEGSTLSVSTGTWTTLGTLTYQWQVSSDNSTWSDISGATSSSYLLLSAQNGKYVRAQILNSTSAGDGIAYSAPTLKIGAPVCSATPVISGTLRVGSTQTVTSGTWSASPTYSYQWQKSSDGIAWTSIGSATTSTYTPTFDVANLNIRVLVSAANAVDTGTVTSNIITNLLPPVATAIPSITGTKTSGQTLTAASPGTWPGASNGYLYQWQRSSDGTNWSDISGATATTYVLAASDVGYQVRVQVSLTTNAGTSAAYSLATVPIS
jgi:Fibronectin type III domain